VDARTRRPRPSSRTRWSHRSADHGHVGDTLWDDWHALLGHEFLACSSTGRFSSGLSARATTTPSSLWAQSRRPASPAPSSPLRGLPWPPPLPTGHRGHRLRL